MEFRSTPIGYSNRAHPRYTLNTLHYTQIGSELTPSLFTLQQQRRYTNFGTFQNDF